MNFGTGEKVYEKDEGVLLDSELLPAAVKCWFTVQGRGMPLSMKIRNEEGEIQTMEPIFTSSLEISVPGLSGGDRKILLSVFLSGGGEVESGEIKLFQD